MVLLSRNQEWYCPRCKEHAVTVDDKVPFHHCAGLRGLFYGLIPVGQSAKVTAMEREDYIGTEDVQFDGEGRPTMSVVTTRDDGQDCVVYAPTAHMKGG